jgi:hypothetical protein
MGDPSVGLALAAARGKRRRPFCQGAGAKQ